VWTSLNTNFTQGYFCAVIGIGSGLELTEVVSTQQLRLDERQYKHFTRRRRDLKLPETSYSYLLPWRQHRRQQQGNGT